MYRSAAALFVVTMLLPVSHVASAASKEEDALSAGCDWLERAIAREPERDDAFGMFMRGMRPKCQAMLEGIARKDNSVRPDAMRQIVKEIAELQSVIDAEHGGPPPAAGGPSPSDVARQKVADEKAAADKAAADKAAGDKAVSDKAAADKAAEEARRAQFAADQKAAEEAQKAAERDAARQAAADKKAEEDAKKTAERDAKERAAANKKAEAEAKKAAEREAKERAAADKKAEAEAKKAEAEAKKAAEREAKERAVADKKAEAEAKKQAEADAKAEAERQQEEAKRQAEALVNAEAEAEKREAEKREAMERAKQLAAQPPVKTTPKKHGALDGTWEQPEARVLDRNVKRTLNILSKDKKIQGELYEEVWFEAPSAWIDSSCGGNTTFRMVTTARVNGEVEGGNMVLSRDPPRILTCTCSSRCTVETRRRGFDLAIAASGAELRDQTGVFVRPGTAIVTKSSDTGESKRVLSPSDFAGNWETGSFKQRDRNVVQRLELTVAADGTVAGSLTERSTQGLPLASWSDRFCGGADKWEWVTQWKLEGRVSGRKAAMRGSNGSNLLCSCPSKCTEPKDKLGFDLVYGATGATLQIGDQVFERR